MKIKVTNIKKNPLLEREEISGIIEHDGMPTPSRASVQKYLAKENKVNEKHIDIKKIFSATGREDAKLIAYIWDKKEVPVLEEKKPVKKEPEKKEESEKPKEEAKPVEKEPEKKEEPKKEETVEKKEKETKEPAKKEEAPKEEKPKEEPEKKVEEKKETKSEKDDKK